jgi:amino acid transporter
LENTGKLKLEQVESRSNTAPKAALSRTIKLRQLFTLAFGTIVGVGWIPMMGFWLDEAGPFGSVMAFALGGVAMLLVGLFYAELATVYPESGGEVVYAEKMFGKNMAFATGWALSLTYIGATGFLSISFGWIAGEILRSIGVEVEAISASLAPADIELFLGLGMTLFITGVNFIGARVMAAVQDSVTILLIIFTTIFVLLALIFGDVGNLEPYFGMKRPDGRIHAGFLLVLATTPFWFAGFDTIPQAMGETNVRASLKAVAQIIILSIASATVFYCAVIIATAALLSRESLIHASLAPATALETALGSPVGKQIVLVTGACGLVTSWNAVFYASTRVIFSMGSSQMIPRNFGRIHPTFGSPHIAVLLVGVMGAAISFLGRDGVAKIANIGSAAISGVFLVMAIGYIRLRLSSEKESGLLRMRFGVTISGLAIPVLAVLTCTALISPYSAAGKTWPTEWSLLFGWLLFGLILRFGRKKRQFTERQ